MLVWSGTGLVCIQGKPIKFGRAQFWQGERSPTKPASFLELLQMPNCRIKLVKPMVNSLGSLVMRHRTVWFGSARLGFSIFLYISRGLVPI